MEFLEPLPALASVSSDGTLCFWGVRPDLSSRNRLFHKVGLESQMEPVPLTAMTKRPSETQRLADLVLGEERGHLYVFKAESIEEVLPPEMRQVRPIPQSVNSYNPKRKYV